MGFFEAVVALCSIMAIFGIPLLAIWSHHKRSMARAAGPEVDRLNAVIADMHSDIMKLKDRVAVLERLATSEDRRIAEEIERLSRSTTLGA